jgi:ABC-type sulfate transport system permease component
MLCKTPRDTAAAAVCVYVQCVECVCVLCVCVLCVCVCVILSVYLQHTHTGWNRREAATRRNRLGENRPKTSPSAFVSAIYVIFCVRLTAYFLRVCARVFMQGVCVCVCVCDVVCNIMLRGI